MSLIIHGILKQDQYTNNDLYYPDWDKINNFNGEDLILILEELIKIYQILNQKFHKIRRIKF